MTTSSPDTTCAPLESLLDLFVFAPLALVLDAATVGPDLAAKGRQHVANARVLGEMAVKQGRRRLEEMGGTPMPDAPPSASEAPRGPVDTFPSPEDSAAVGVDTPDAAGLAIIDYDLLAASQVVQRLSGLQPDELEDVRLYETANRGRRTILTKIARLQG